MQRPQSPWPLHFLGLNLEISVWVEVHAGKKMEGAFVVFTAGLVWQINV